MDKILFNFNDLPLLLVISECFLLAGLLLLIRKGNPLSNYILAIFLVMYSIEAFDTLIFWSAPIKQNIFPDSIHIFFVLEFAVFLQGPLIYWYTKSLIYSDFSIHRKEFLHLIPLLIFPFYLVWFYQNLGYDQILLGIWDYNILFENIPYRILLFSQKIALCSYAAASLYKIIQHRKHIQQSFSNIERIDLNWLRLLTGGFLSIWIWSFGAQFYAQFGWGRLADITGLMTNYLSYIFVNSLVIYSLLQSDVIHGARRKNQVTKTDSSEAFNEKQIQQLEQAMTQERCFLEPELTLEQLADRIHLTPRVVSNIINRKFNQNFFEFVNHYRVEEAKKLLRSEDNDYSMLDVMAEAGFNSKSAFNRFFKKYADMTPTQYKNANK